MAPAAQWEIGPQNRALKEQSARQNSQVRRESGTGGNVHCSRMRMATSRAPAATMIPQRSESGSTCTRVNPSRPVSELAITSIAASALRSK